jgi:hypothetical protein
MHVVKEEEGEEGDFLTTSHFNPIASCLKRVVRERWVATK